MTDVRRNPSIGPGAVEPGDVLFFAPPVEEGDFEDFAQLAAYAQGAPWHHTAVAGEPGDDGRLVVIGFGQTGDPGREGLNWSPRIETLPWSSTGSHAITALRPPRRSDEVVAGAAATIGSDYALEGLLAFAAATQARMLMAGPARERLLDFAAGAEVEGRKASSGHTCVTAVIAAIDAAGFRPVCREPAPPDEDRPAPDGWTLDSIDRLYERLERGGTRLGVDVRPDPDSLLRDGQVADGWDPRLVVMAPGLIDRTSAYVDLLTGVIKQRFRDDLTSEQLVSLGQLSRSSGEPVTGWRVSPAMMRSALLDLGFTEVS
jgi:hypothetical protein